MCSGSKIKHTNGSPIFRASFVQAMWKQRVRPKPYKCLWRNFKLVVNSKQVMELHKEISSSHKDPKWAMFEPLSIHRGNYFFSKKSPEDTRPIPSSTLIASQAASFPKPTNYGPHLPPNFKNSSLTWFLCQNTSKPLPINFYHFYNLQIPYIFKPIHFRNPLPKTHFLSLTTLHYSSSSSRSKTYP